MRSIDARAKQYALMNVKEPVKVIDKYIELAKQTYKNAALEQQAIDIERACDVLDKTGYFVATETSTADEIKELFINAVKGNS